MTELEILMDELRQVSRDMHSAILRASERIKRAHEEEEAADRDALVSMDPWDEEIK